MASVKINEDLEKERKKCEFNIKELTNYLDGGADETKRRRTVGRYRFIYQLSKSINLEITKISNL
jgi:hypothetical protein